MPYYGSDSGWDGLSQNPCASGKQFYIGKLGEGTSPISGYFNTTLAQALIARGDGSKVYGYWYLRGPSDPEAAGLTPFNWGVRQADSANQVRADALRYGQINGQTFFVDVEHDDSWSTTDFQSNKDVLNGFLSKITASYRGIYSYPCAWVDVFGSVTWKPSYTPSVLWTAQKFIGGGTCPTWSSVSGATCSTTTNAAQGFGGMSPTIWQYSVNEPTPEGGWIDYDVAPTLPV